MKEKTSDSKSILTKGLHGNGVLRREEGGFFGWFHKHDLLIYFVIVTALGIAMRILLFPCVRGDYTAFLQPWYKNIYENGASALGSQFGDYTPAYNYFLYLISLFGFVPGEVFEVGPIQIDPVLWGIKTVSCLFDFGIAIFQNASHVTQKQIVIGSVHYLAPEVGQGNPATERSDIYSMGITFFGLMVSPFRASMLYSRDRARSKSLPRMRMSSE